VDLRACGVYDVETCESFLCASHAAISEREAAIVEAVADFHLYGLVVPDAAFVRAVLEELADAAGAQVELEELRDPSVSNGLRRLLALKEELEPGSDGIFAAFHRPGALADRGSDRQQPRSREAAVDAILSALGGDPRSGNDPELLEAEVRRRLDACVAALRALRSPRR
jgi:hypothetical protein